MSSRRNSWSSEVLLSCDSCHRLQIKHWQHKRIPHVSVCRLKNMRFLMRMMRILSLKGFGSETDWLMWCRAALCVCGLHHGIIVHLVNTNTETITCQRWINNAFILCWKPRKKPEFWGPDYSEINAAAADLHLLCYFCLPEYFKQ